jgi:hypothetical protein
MPFTPDEIPEWFWDIIRRAGRSKDKLRELLMTMSKDEIYRFAGNFTEAATQLNDDPFLRFVNPDESEDGVMDIAHWVVSQGKEHFAQVWEKPDTIAKHVDVGDPQNLFGVAEKVYEDKFGEDMPDLYDDSGYPVFQ